MPKTMGSDQLMWQSQHLSVRLLSALVTLYPHAYEAPQFCGAARRKSARGCHEMQKASEICMTTQMRPVRALSSQSEPIFQ